MQFHRKHILFLASWYPQRNSLDNGDFIQRHAQAVVTLHDVTVVHAVKDPMLKDSKFEIEHRTIKGVKEVVVYVKPSRFRPFNFFYLLQGFLVGVKQVRPFHLIHLNVVFPAGIIGLYLKSKYKIPLILTEHWTHLHPNKFKELARYKQLVIRRILDHVDIILPVSHHLGESLQRINSSIQFHVIPNVVDIDQFKIHSKKQSSKIKFLHLSHLGDEHKNISGMLRVAKRLVDQGYDFEFHIGGNGDIEPIEKFIQLHYLENYIFPFGRLVHQEVNAKMNTADCFVLFSRFENQPCVQAEAFACGIPLIATDVGGIKEFLPEGFGILIESENENQLYEAMKDVIMGKQFKSSTLLNQYAKQHFSIAAIAQQFNHIYNQLLP